MNPAPRQLTATGIIQELESLTRDGVGGGLVFDGDGTLWSGDVGEEAFEAAIAGGLLREEVVPRLRQEAMAFSLSTEGDAAQLATRLLLAYRNGTYPELRVCELMVWCYAGWTESELRQHVRQTLARDTSRVSHYQPLAPIRAWAQARGLRCVIVSASPKLVVEEAAEALGFEPEDVVGGRAQVERGLLQTTLLDPIPYGASKETMGRALLRESPWLATFGDNVFDLEMLRAAKLAVAVRPKQRLLDALHLLSDPVLFREE